MLPRGRDFGVGLALALGFLVLYGLTLCRTVYWYDSAEYVAAAYTLGIPHPPGAPLYTILGHLFTWLPVDPALAVNAMSAVFGALSVGLAYAMGRAAGLGRLAAAAGAGTLGALPLYWEQAIIAEVYTPAIAFLMGVVALVLHGLHHRRPRQLALAAGLAGLGTGVHLSIATTGLGLVVLVLGYGVERGNPGDLRRLASRENLGQRCGIAARCALAVLLGAAIHLYIPLRNAMAPAVNVLADARAAVAGQLSDRELLVWFLSGGNYKSWFLEDYPLLERGGMVLAIFYQQLGPAGLALAAAGAARLAIRRPLLVVGFALMAAGNTYFFFNYNVHDLGVFFLPSLAVLCCLVGAGADAIAAVAARAAPALRAAVIRRSVPALACILPVSLIATNYTRLDLSGFDEAEKYGLALAEQLPPQAVILTFGSPPEWPRMAVFADYFQKVRGVRPDVTVWRGASEAVLDRLMESRTRTYLFARPTAWPDFFPLRQEGVLLRVEWP